MDNEFIVDYIKPVIGILYDNDALLFEYDISERCIAFRFAHYLQNRFDQLGEYEVFVDCDFNSRVEFLEGEWTRRHGKLLQDRDGNGETGRFVDIIVHRRCRNKIPEGYSDLICFELKKWNNQSESKNDKDRNNLERLTSDYGYKFGFHIIFGEVIGNVVGEIFEEGRSLGTPFNLFG